VAAYSIRHAINPGIPMRTSLPAFAFLVRIGLCTCVCLASSCDDNSHPHANTSPPSTIPTPAPPPHLTRTILDLTKAHPDAGKSLAVLSKALTLDPTSPELRDQTTQILAETRWHLPEIRIQHPASIERIHFGTPSQLWVGISGKNKHHGAVSTVIHWDLSPLQIQGILFPASDTSTRSLVLNPSRLTLVLERAGFLLLCDAQTLKPIREIGILPGTLNPSTTIVFSADGLLLAHPCHTGTDNSPPRWFIRDALAGEIIREFSPDPPTSSPPIAAHLDSRSLRLLHQDGTLTHIPLSPVESVSTTAPPRPTLLTQALFTPHGNNAFVLQSDPPDGFRWSKFLHRKNRDGFSPRTADLLHPFPWNKHPGIWSGLFASRFNGFSLPYHYSPGHAPARTATDITALALCENRLATGDVRGFLIIETILPTPLPKYDSTEPADFTSTSLQALAHLTTALAGLSYHPEFRTFSNHTLEDRLLAFENCDFTTLASAFPSLDFSPLIQAFETFQHRPVSPETLAPLHDRLTRFSKRPTFPDIEEAFANANEETIIASIDNAAPSGPQAATCLALALASTQPAWIARCLASFTDIPLLLTRIARSRIDWLENRKADAIAAWPEPFPNYDHIRRSEDWDGWEATDFRIAFEQIRQSVDEELTRLVVPENASPEQRDATFAHLTNEATLASIGRARYARACLDAATRLAAFPEETERTFELAKIARAMGAPPAPCLRAEALSLTALQDHARARDRWVELITHQPIAEHQPGDYAEAAYSSFENSDPTQAMAILATGMHRYPQDAAFALRAGWIALLTAHPEAAYRFLLAGHRVGWPQEQAAYACALLAIAAFQSGAPEESAAWFEELVRIDASWREETSIAELTWPDELKAVLHHLAEHALVTPDR
jgi:tetratricopeptide (TPR) repeat protein